MRRTVAGVLPEGWDGQLLKQVANVVRGSSPRPAGSPLLFDGDHLPWVTVADITRNDNRYLTSTKSKLTELGAESTRITHPGTLMLTNSGATLGVPKISKLKSGANDGIAMLLDLDGVDTEYLYYFLLSKTRYFREVLAPGVGQPNLNTEIIGDFPVPVPPLKEQHRIAKILSTWDEAIAITEKLLAKSEQQKKALMQQLLTGKKRLPGFEGEWDEVPLGDVVNIGKGKALSSKDLKCGPYPVVAGGKKSPYKHAIFTHENAITVSASGAYAGYVAYHAYKFWASDCSVVEASERTDIRFIGHLLRWNQNRIYALQSGGAQPHVYPKDLQLMRIYLPRIDEQIAIADVLNKTGFEAALLSEGVSRLNEEKKALRDCSEFCVTVISR
tara:strand:+ start:775 stop:1932 length:1158 start_codon:yes stop_codon:yes gene_type:complete